MLICYGHYYYWSFLYSTVLCSWAYSLHSCRMWLNELYPFYGTFLISTKVVYWQRCFVVTWLVPHLAAALWAQFLCTPYNYAPVYGVTSFGATYVECMLVSRWCGGLFFLFKCFGLWTLSVTFFVCSDFNVTLPLTMKETLKWLSLLPILMQNHSGCDCVALGIVPPSPSWDLSPCQHLSGDNSAPLRRQMLLP